MGNSYIGETILIRTALKLRRLTSQFAEEHIDIFYILITCRLHDATSRRCPMILFCRFYLNPIIFLRDNIWKILGGNQAYLLHTERSSTAKFFHHVHYYIFQFLTLTIAIRTRNSSCFFIQV